MQNEFYHIFQQDVSNAEAYKLSELKQFSGLLRAVMEFIEFKQLIATIDKTLDDLTIQAQFMDDEQRKVINALIHSLQMDKYEHRLRHKHIFNRLQEVSEALQMQQKRSKRLNLTASD